MSRSTRREWLRGGAALATERIFGAPASAAVYAYVGCYTSAERKARGDGIHAYRVDSATGAWTHIQHVGNLVNPSFLAVSHDQRHLYSVHGDETYATSFSIDQHSGFLTLLNRAETGGRNGVHLAFDNSGKFLVIANYATGSAAVLPVRQDGTLGDAIQQVALEGQPGPHRIEQTSSHPHHVIFDPSGRFVLIPDKGLDKIFIFSFDRMTGRLTPTAQGSAISRAGSAPRHAAFHPTLPVCWVINELNSSIATYRFDPGNGALQPVQILPSLPSDFTGASSGAEIAVAPGGRFVYCSNRGHDSIAIFTANARTGLLASVGWVPSQGRVPRFIGFDPSGSYLYATNEQSDTVAAFRADPATGQLKPAGQPVRNLSPVTIAFATLHA